MQGKPLIIRGRKLSSDDIVFIKGCITSYWEKGRSYISRVLCEVWDWRQPNGRLKDRACRVVLLQLEQLGYITLPPRKIDKNNTKRRQFDNIPEFSTKVLTGKVGDYSSLTIEMVRLTEKERLWNYLVDRYHYLGNPGIVGSYLKYLVYINGGACAGRQVVACLGWGAPAWRVGVREKYIGWSDEQRRKRLHLLVNNIRFLILPWIRIRYLASKVLAENIRVLSSDWQLFYEHAIVLLETFVEKSRFSGTCYKAANWHFVGYTKGFAKRGNDHINHGNSKAVYVYPLVRGFKRQLTDE